MPEMAVKPGRMIPRFLAAVAIAYCGLWFAFDIRFVAHCFAMPYLPGMAFFQRFSGYAGGPAQYAANLFSQAYSRRWLGILAFLILALAFWVIARGILRRFGCASCNAPAMIFPLLMLILTSRYIAVVYVLPVAAGLAIAWLYMEARGRLPQDRGGPFAVMAVFLIACVPLYYLTASGLAFFCAAGALYELLPGKRRLLAILWLCASALIPAAMSLVYFEPDVFTRYFRWIATPENGRGVTALLIAFYAFVPAAAFAAFFFNRRSWPVRLRLPAQRGLQLFVVAAISAGLLVMRLDRPGWIYADYLIAGGRLEEGLDHLRKLQDDSDPVRFLTLQALARAGRLTSDMFYYPQRKSSEALLLRDPKWDSFPRVANWRSDLYLELGRVNESQRWAHESLAVEGETPRVLERLSLVYILNGGADAGRIFLNALRRVPFQSARAEARLAALSADPSMRGDPLVSRIRALMLRSDYVGNWPTERVFQQCLEANPANRLAFEYLTAHYLLNCDMKGLGSIAPRFGEFYRALPAHVQEALLVFRHVHGNYPAGFDSSSIDPQMEERFGVFMATLEQHQDGFEDTWNALAGGFGRTYWFFDAFGRTAAGPPPKPPGEGDPR